MYVLDPKLRTLCSGWFPASSTERKRQGISGTHDPCILWVEWLLLEWSMGKRCQVLSQPHARYQAPCIVLDVLHLGSDKYCNPVTGTAYACVAQATHHIGTTSCSCNVYLHFLYFTIILQSETLRNAIGVVTVRINRYRHQIYNCG